MLKKVITTGFVQLNKQANKKRNKIKQNKPQESFTHFR